MSFLERRSQRKRRKYWDYGTTFNSEGFSVYLFSGITNQTPNLTQRLWDVMGWGKDSLWLSEVLSV